MRLKRHLHGEECAIVLFTQYVLPSFHRDQAIAIPMTARRAEGQPSVRPYLPRQSSMGDLDAVKDVRLIG